MPHTIDDLWEMIYGNQQAMIYAGGTDVLARYRSLTSRNLTCIEDIHELKEIYQQDNLIFIGSCVTHTRLLESKIIQKHLPVLIHALKVLGSPQIRNMGTIGGNICTASPAGDTLPPLYVLGAILEIRSIDSKRFTALKNFIHGPGKNSLQKDEVLYGIWINTKQDFNIHHYEKVGQRKMLAIAIASLAALLKLSKSGIIEDARLAWGSVGPKIIASEKINKALIGKTLTEASLKLIVPLIREAVSPIDDIRASAHYRKMVSENLIFRLLKYGGHNND